ncbi:MAG: DNA alkylation repair protein [Acidobacteriota bacterium]|nr:DNA alkylation repair protein [Acidobacteriota bacterium]
MNDLVAPLRSLFLKNVHAENAFHMKRYMRDKFAFYGIKTPRRKELVKQFLEKRGSLTRAELITVVHTLWDLPERENQYAALDLMYATGKILDTDQIPLTEELAVTKSWWDSVDPLSIRVMGMLLSKAEVPRLFGPDRWIESDNFWLRRCALLFQLKYKQRTDSDLLFEYIRRLAHEKEFFIRKAIGWALREYSKTDGEAVIQFVADTDLSTLSEREGLKWLQEHDEL